MKKQTFTVGAVVKVDTEAVKQEHSWMRHLETPLVGGEVAKVLAIEHKEAETYLTVKHNKMKTESTFNARYFRNPQLKSKSLTND